MNPLGEDQMAGSISPELSLEIGRLDSKDQRRVLEFVRSLNEPIKGTPGHVTASFAGCIPSDDLERMKIAIEEGCEQVDPNEW
jgi:hypothetical protein